MPTPHLSLETISHSIESGNQVYPLWDWNHVQLTWDWEPCQTHECGFKDWGCVKTHQQANDIMDYKVCLIHTTEYLRNYILLLNYSKLYSHTLKYLPNTKKYLSWICILIWFHHIALTNLHQITCLSSGIKSNATSSYILSTTNMGIFTALLIDLIAYIPLLTKSIQYSLGLPLFHLMAKYVLPTSTPKGGYIGLCMVLCRSSNGNGNLAR